MGQRNSSIELSSIFFGSFETQLAGEVTYNFFVVGEQLGASETEFRSFRRARHFAERWQREEVVVRAS